MVVGSQGEEQILEQLQNDWSSVGIETLWKLESILSSSRHVPFDYTDASAAT